MRFYRLLFEFVVFVVYGALWCFGILVARVLRSEGIYETLSMCYFGTSAVCFFLCYVFYAFCCFTVVVFENVVYGTWRTP